MVFADPDRFLCRSIRFLSGNTVSAARLIARVASTFDADISRYWEDQMYGKNCVATLAMILGLGFVAPTQAQETLLFDGGTPSGPSGLRVSDRVFVASAADFTTTDAWNLTGAEFWTTEWAGMFEWDGTVEYFILEDESGMPSGSPIFSGYGTSIVKEPDPRPSPLGFSYNFDFETPLELQAETTYWLALRLGGGGTLGTTQAFWAATSPGFQEGAKITHDPNLLSWSSYSFDLAFRLYGIEDAETVSVDFNPGSCPNPLQTGSNGVLSVAITGTSELDVTMIDAASIRLEGVAPIRSALEDVATPYEPFTGKEGAFDCTDFGSDGFEDLMLKFDRQQISAALGEPEDGDVLVLGLSGSLLEEFGATPIGGEDVVLIRKRSLH